MKQIVNGYWDGQPITREQTASELLLEILTNEKKMSNPINSILAEEFSQKEIQAMPEVDPNEAYEREKDEANEPQCFEQQENNFVNSL